MWWKEVYFTPNSQFYSRKVAGVLHFYTHSGISLWFSIFYECTFSTFIAKNLHFCSVFMYFVFVFSWKSITFVA